MPVLELNDSTFDEVVGGAPVPVLVQFTATWCGPCRLLAPVLEELATELAETLVVAKIDVDDNAIAVCRHAVMATPTLLLFVDGQVRHRLVGARGKARLIDELADALPLRD